MAWNEPGKGNGGGDKDPWGNNQGPPDLDEALKKMKNQLSGIFGGKFGSGPPGGGGTQLSANLVGLVLAALLLVPWSMA